MILAATTTMVVTVQPTGSANPAAITQVETIMAHVFAKWDGLEMIVISEF